ncbi:MAG: hypothetical protein DRQ55_11235 [Planctomycetota bacterium]|nr:MAG: hypothetical protein DRQ55_11235 [Planctomycetota bacterium]
MPAIPQRGFFGGEITPALHARRELPAVASGLALCRNAIPCRTGGLVNRMGTAWLRELAGGDANTRFVGIRFAADDAVTLAVGPRWIRLLLDLGIALSGAGAPWADATAYDVGAIASQSGGYYYCAATHTSAAGLNEPTTAGQDDQHWHPLALEGASAVLELPTIWPTSDLAELQFSPGGDRVMVTHPDHPPHEIVRWGDGRWTCLPAAFRPAITRPLAVAHSLGGAGTGTLRYKITARQKDTYAESAAGLLNASKAGTIDAAVLADPANDVAVDSVAHGFATGDVIGFSSVTPSTGDLANENASIALQGRSWTITLDATTPLDRFSLDDSAGVLTWPAIAPATYPDIAVTFNADELTVTADPPTLGAPGSWVYMIFATLDPTVDEYLIYRSDNEAPYGLIGSSKYPLFTDKGAVTNPDETFQPPSFRLPFRHRRWPVCSTFWKQRQIFAGGHDTALRVLGSGLGDFYNFRSGLPVLASDSFDLTIPELEAHAIVGIDSVGDLAVRTTGPFVILSPVGGLVAPGNIEVTSVTSQGSSKVAAVRAGGSLLYVHRQGALVLEARFAPESGGPAGYLGRNLTDLAPHLFHGHTITKLAWAETPEPVAFAVRDDGVLLSLTYDPERELWAWARHDTGGSTDKVLDVTVIPEEGQDLVYVYVQREVNSSTVYYAERLAPRTIGFAGDDPHLSGLFLDSALTSQAVEHAGGVTQTLSGGSPWTAGSSATMTNSGGIAVAGDVGRPTRLFDAADVAIHVVITAYVDPNTVTVTLLDDVPVTLQGLADAWMPLYRWVTGLGHLEGRDVRVLANGLPLGPFTVVSGQIDLGEVTTSSQACDVVLVGLPIAVRVQLLPPDVLDERFGVMGATMTISKPALLLEHTRGLSVGVDEARLTRLVDEDPGAAATAPLNGMVVCEIDSREARWSGLILALDEPLPMAVHALEYQVGIGER